VIREISTESLIDRRQIGWIAYQEGDALIRVKVIRAKNGKPFLAHVTGWRKGIVVRTVDYIDKEVWRQKSEYLLNAFKEHVGSEFWQNFRNDK